METYKKLNENEIEVTSTPVVEPTKIKYEVGYLKSQRESIINQRDEFVAQREIEIAEVDRLLAECSKLNVVEKAKEEVLPVEKIIK